MLRPPTRSTLFPYTTLFRSVALPGEATDRASAVPLGIAAARRRTQHDGGQTAHAPAQAGRGGGIDRKSTRLNSSHLGISYAVFCLKKNKKSDESARYDLNRR